MIYSDIKVINEKFIACNTASSSQEVETKKDELTKVQENAQISQDIKASMKEEVGEELNFVCDDFYAKYDVYEVEDKNRKDAEEQFNQINIWINNFSSNINGKMDKLKNYVALNLKNLTQSLNDNDNDKSSN